MNSAKKKKGNAQIMFILFIQAVQNISENIVNRIKYESWRGPYINHLFKVTQGVINKVF